MQLVPSVGKMMVNQLHVVSTYKCNLWQIEKKTGTFNSSDYF